MPIFDAIVNLLDSVINGLIKVATPVAVIAVIIAGIGAKTSTNHKDQFKSALIWVCVVYLIVISARGIISFLSNLQV